MFLVLVAIAIAALDATQEIDFIGFSPDRRVVAWRAYIREPATTGSYDEFRLIRVAEVPTGRLLREYREGKLSRHRWDGKPFHAHAGPLAQLHPRYLRAAPAKEWQLLRGRVTFGKRLVRMDDATVRLRLDADTQVVYARATAEQISVESASGSPLGFAVVARLGSGEHVSLARFRDAPTSVPRLTSVRVYRSIDGHAAAVLRHDSMTASIRFTGALMAPLGVPELGLAALHAYRNAQLDEIVANLHPGAPQQAGQWLGYSW